jgi:AcrR family transcriptional regulator
MRSHKSTSTRRIPKQDRSENRIRQILATAEELIYDRGLEAVTMTEIAAEASMSIGALYQYFPNKDAIATAMRTAYAEEMDRLWSEFLSQEEKLNLHGFTDGIVDLMTGFISAHPAYLALFSSSVRSTRSDAERESLRMRFAQTFIRRAPGMGKADAMRMAQIALAMVKSLIGLCIQALPAEKLRLEIEMKTALFGYFSTRLNRE